MEPKPMTAQWVIGTFTGDEAKRVKAHADAKTGYYVRQEFAAGTPKYSIVAAFRRPSSNPLPPHLVVAPPDVVEKLDELEARRKGY